MATPKIRLYQSSRAVPMRLVLASEPDTMLLEILRFLNEMLAETRDKMVNDGQIAYENADEKKIPTLTFTFESYAQPAPVLSRLVDANGTEREEKFSDGH